MTRPRRTLSLTDAQRRELGVASVKLRGGDFSGERAAGRWGRETERLAERTQAGGSSTARRCRQGQVVIPGEPVGGVVLHGLGMAFQRHEVIEGVDLV